MRPELWDALSGQDDCVHISSVYEKSVEQLIKQPGGEKSGHYLLLLLEPHLEVGRDPPTTEGRLRMAQAATFSSWTKTRDRLPENRPSTKVVYKILHRAPPGQGRRSEGPRAPVVA